MKNKIATILAKHRDLVVFASLFIIIFSVHYPLLKLGFFSDDYHMLKIVKDGGQSIFQIFTTNLIGTNLGHSYGPIFKIIFSIEYKLFGLNPFGYHTFSLLLHFFSSIFVYLIAKQFADRSPIPAASALLFSILPVHVEALAWVGVQPHLLATLGYLAAIYFYLKHKNTKHVQWIVLSTTSALLALFSKDTAITLIGTLLLIELIFTTKKQTKILDLKSLISSTKSAAIKLLPFIALTITYLLLRANATGSATAAYTGSLALNYINIERMFVELSTAIFFPSWRMALAQFMQAGPLVVFPISIGIFGTLIYIIRKSLGMILLLGIYIITTLPFMFVAFNQINEEGNRYAYLSSSIAVMILAALVYNLTNHTKQRRHIFAFIITLIFFINIQATQYRFKAWQIADAKVDEIIHSELINNLDEELSYTFITLPDNVAGAQVMRNGIFEAIELETNKKLTGERIPIYTEFSSLEKPIQWLTISPDELGILNITKKYIQNDFTGFGAFESSSGFYTIENWDKWGSIGDNITIEPRDIKNIIYYSHGQLKLYKVE